MSSTILTSVPLISARPPSGGGGAGRGLAPQPPAVVPQGPEQDRVRPERAGQLQGDERTALRLRPHVHSAHVRGQDGAGRHAGGSAEQHEAHGPGERVFKPGGLKK